MEYQIREIYIKPYNYVRCQILNWSKGHPPHYLVCNILNGPRAGNTILAAQIAGCWMEKNLEDVLFDIAFGKVKPEDLLQKIN